MKILLVNDYATPTGGAELLTLALRSGLRERGHDARFFASSARPGGNSSFADYECFGTTSLLRTPLQLSSGAADLLSGESSLIADFAAETKEMSNEHDEQNAKPDRAVQDFYEVALSQDKKFGSANSTS